MFHDDQNVSFANTDRTPAMCSACMHRHLARFLTDSLVHTIYWLLFFTAAYVAQPYFTSKCFAQQIRETQSEAGFRSLFNGRDFQGWQGAVEGYFVENGELVCKQGAGGVLYTEEEFTDFEARLEFLLPPGGNNGLAIRYPGTGRASVDAMCEIQILDDEAEKYNALDPRQYTGSVYGMIAAQRGHLKPVGIWNEMQVVVRGSTIIVNLNGTEILNGDVSKVTAFKDNQAHPGKDRTQGYFGFAGHDDPVRFRNIRIKPLPQLEICTFSLDVTIPLEHRCMGILPQKSKSIVDPLYAHGFALFGVDQPIAIVAVDWCEIRNASYDLWRDTIAKALGTTRERVLVSALHQHDAPVVDHDAYRLLAEVGLHDELFQAAFHENVLERLSSTIRLSATRRIPVTHIGYAETKVVDVASNRKMIDSDGNVHFSRGSSSGRESIFKDAPVGLIDENLRTLSFWNDERCLVEYHAYATHPMSYYGRGEVTSDFVGLARQRRQRDDLATLQIYASGCSGDVTAGKYNDGTPAAREELTNKIYQAMVAARSSTQRISATSFEFRTVPLNIPYTSDPKLQSDFLQAELDNATLPTEKRILAAMGLASIARVKRQQAIDFPCVDFGITRLLLFPGESFVGYQVIAQEYSPGIPVIPVGYGECWTGYVPTDQAFRDGFNESWLWAGKGSEAEIRRALEQVLSH